MAQIIHHAGESSVYQVEGATVDVLITPSVTAYMQFFTSEDAVNWTVLVPGAVYKDPISKTFTAPELGAYVKCEVYGGIGEVSLSASGRTIPPLVVDAAPTIAGNDLWAGNTLTMTPATFSGGTTPYEIDNVWQLNTGTWETVATGSLTYTIPTGDQFIGRPIRAQSVCTDSSSMWDVPNNTITATSTAVTIIEEPVPDIVVTQKTGISGTVKIGKTLTAIAPVWTGGGDDSSVTSYQWNNQNGGTLHTGSTYVIDSSEVGNTIRCVGTISSPRQNVPSVSDPTITVPPQTQIGVVDVEVNGAGYDTQIVPVLNVCMNTAVRIAVGISGDASPTYQWDCRQVGALYTVTNVEPNGSIVDISIAENKALTFTCVMQDANSTDSPKSVEVQLFASPVYSVGGTTLTVNGTSYSGDVSISEGKDETVTMSIAYDGDLPANSAKYRWYRTAGGGGFEGAMDEATAVFNTGMTFGNNKIQCEITGTQCTADSPKNSNVITISVT